MVVLAGFRWFGGCGVDRVGGFSVLWLRRMVVIGLPHRITTSGAGFSGDRRLAYCASSGYAKLSRAGITPAFAKDLYLPL